jgi:hypothetical protein
VPRSTNCFTVWPGFSNDFMCLAGADETSGPGALIRGGAFGNGRLAGPFAVSGLMLPSDSGSDIGFRAAR